MLKQILSNINKTSSEFNVLFVKAYSLLRAKNLQESVLVYNLIFDKFSSLKNKEKNKKLVNDIKILYREITIYSSLNKAYQSALKSDLKPLREELETLHDLAYNISLEDSEFKRIEKENINPLLFEVITKKPKISDIENSIVASEELTSLRKFNEALLGYCRSLILFRKIISELPQEKKTGLYFRLRKIFKYLLLNNISSSYSTSKKSKKSEILGFEETYQKIQESLKKGDIKTASKLYKYL